MAVIAALDAKTDLAGVTTGGVINEDVMQKIWDISRIPLPFSDRCGTGSVSAAQYDWVTDKLATAAQNKWVETANFGTSTASGVTDFADTATVPTIRYRNHIQISVKAISVSEMANAVSSVGGSGGLEYNLMVAQQELKRDIEVSAMGNYASVAGNGTTTAPVTAGYIAGCKDQTSPTRNLFMSTTGTNPATEGGYNTSTSVFDAATISSGKAALQEADLRDVAEALYNGGCGGPNQSLVAMCAPGIKRIISTYMLSTSARIVTPVNNIREGNMPIVTGAVEVFITDFGTLELVPNRFLGDLGTNQYHLMIYDPAYFDLVYLRGINTTAGAKLGLVERRIVNAYWGTRFNPECMGVIMDIDNTAAMTA